MCAPENEKHLRIHNKVGAIVITRIAMNHDELIRHVQKTRRIRQYI